MIPLFGIFPYGLGLVLFKNKKGRTKPVLIESNDSKLAERLQINEFLYSAQQARNPVPMIIEKISHVLELLHTAQTQSDQ